MTLLDFIYMALHVHCRRPHSLISDSFPKGLFRTSFTDDQCAYSSPWNTLTPLNGITHSVKSNSLSMMCKPTNRQKSATPPGMGGQDSFRLLYEQSTDAIFIVNRITGRYLDANRAAERFTGYPPEAFYKDPSLLWSIVHADDRQRVSSHLESLNNPTADTCSLDFRIVDAHGRIKWINHYCLPVFADDGIFLGRRASNRDISERKLHEEQLKTSEQRFRELFDNMCAAVAICDRCDADASFIFKDLNQSCLKYIDRDAEAVIGRDVRDVFPGIEALGLLDVFHRVWDSGIPERHPASHYHDARIDAWIESYICKLPSGELVAICEDITAKHQSQETQARLEKQIQEVQKLESIGVLAGGIAHDFNNILFPISGMSEMLMEDLPEGSPEHESVSEIYQAARRAGDLVKQILSFSRRAEHKKMPTRIQQLLKEIIKLVRSTIPANIEIVYDIKNNCPPTMSDPTQLHQIAMNLITNAYQAMETTRGRITVRLKEITVKDSIAPGLTLPAGRYAQFSVADTGCGIEPGVMDKIFEPYFTTKVQGKGTGLGLSVVYGIVKDHHGDILMKPIRRSEMIRTVRQVLDEACNEAG